jgi:hypothetical protein
MDGVLSKEEGITLSKEWLCSDFLSCFASLSFVRILLPALLRMVLAPLTRSGSWTESNMYIGLRALS